MTLDRVHEPKAVNPQMIEFNNASFAQLRASPEYAKEIEPVLIDRDQILPSYKGSALWREFTDSGYRVENL